MKKLRILHVIYRFAEGGLENGLVNLINHLPAERFDHAVLALDEVTAYATRITREDVLLRAFHKQPGHGVGLLGRFAALLREWPADVVHTRGLAALEMAPVARWRGMPVIHGEHGWDAADPGGQRRKYQLLRRLYRPFVTHYVAVSGGITDYLVRCVGVAPNAISRICNGVDLTRFVPAPTRAAIPGCPFAGEALRCVGYVGRLAAVKDPLTLVAAFSYAVKALPLLRLVLVGDGPMNEAVRAAVAASGRQHEVWCAGVRDDVAQVMQGLDGFVLPSRAEGISNTVLEAMACGLPVIATAVGGNRELVVPGKTGWLVPPGEPAALSHALEALGRDPASAAAMGQAGRARVESGFSLARMVQGYGALYERFAAR